MLNLSNPSMKLFIQSDWGTFQVRAICKSDGEANGVCATDKSIAVICEDKTSGLIFVADLKPVS